MKKAIVAILLILCLVLPASALQINNPENELLTSTHNKYLNISLTAENASLTTCEYEILYNDHTTGNSSISCSGGYINFLTTGNNTIKVYALQAGSVINETNSSALIVRHESNITIFMILFFIAIIALFIYLLIKSIEQIILINYNTKWLTYNMIYYFSLLTFALFYSEFIKFGFIDLTNILIKVASFSHFVLPITAFIVSFMLNKLKLKKELEQNG